MSIFCAEVSWSVAVYFFSIRVSACHQKRLYHCKVTSNACNVQRSSEVFGSGVNDSSVFNQDLNQSHVALTGSHMKGCPSICVGAVNTKLSSCSVLILEYLQGCQLIA
jgi:hypothetical protein